MMEEAAKTILTNLGHSSIACHEFQNSKSIFEFVYIWSLFIQIMILVSFLKL